MKFTAPGLLQQHWFLDLLRRTTMLLHWPEDHNNDPVDYEGDFERGLRYDSEFGRAALH